MTSWVLFGCSSAKLQFGHEPVVVLSCLQLSCDPTSQAIGSMCKAGFLLASTRVHSTGIAGLELQSCSSPCLMRDTL